MMIAPALDLDALLDGPPPSSWLTDVAPARLELLLGDAHRSSLTELGTLALQAELEHALVAASTADAEHPPAQGLTDAVVVGGLPRTGTTYLHHLLASASTRRVFRGWEAFAPWMVHDPVAAGEARREAAERYELAAQVSPKVHAMHPLEADGVEECTPLLQHSLESLHWAFMFDAPTYTDWILDTPLTSAYRLWAAQLRQIDPSQPPWLLKSPLHMCDYRSLFDAAPAARLVQVRRSAPEVVQSLLNLVHGARSVFEDDVDPARLGPFWLPRLRRLLDRATRALEALEIEPVVIDYPLLVDHPEHVVADLGERLGLRRPTARTGSVHIPRPGRYESLPLEEFGLDQQRVRTAFTDHIGGSFLLT